MKVTNSRFKNDEKVDVIKRFAVHGRWCTIVDTAGGKVSKAMKKGESLMQIPIQSLNTMHIKSYDFDFDPKVFKYHLSDKELDEIHLVLESGEDFKFPDIATSITKENKRNKKTYLKKETGELKQRININVVEKHEGKKGRCIYI